MISVVLVIILGNTIYNLYGNTNKLLLLLLLHNRQTSSRKQSFSCIKARFSSPEWMMEDFPFFCGWGWDLVDSFVFSWPFNGTLHDFKGFQLVSISVSFCDLGVKLYTLDLVKFLRRRLSQDIFFKMAGSGLASEDFVHSLFCGAGQKTTYVYSQRQSWALVLLRWNYQEPGKMYPLERAINLLLCGFRLFVLLAWYHTDLEQMLNNKRQNIRQNEHWMLETSCKVGLQPEGAHYHHSETAIEFVILFWKRKDNNNKVLTITCSCIIRNTVAFCLSFSWNFIGHVKLTLKSDWLCCLTVPFSLAEKKMRFRPNNIAIRE